MRKAIFTTLNDAAPIAAMPTSTRLNPSTQGQGRESRDRTIIEGCFGGSRTLSVAITGDIADDLNFTSGALAMTDDSGEWLTGTLARVSTVSDPGGDDTVEMLFDTLGGPAGTEFGTFSVATLTGEFGATPFGLTSPMSTFGVTGSSMINSAIPAAIPLPAWFPLLIAPSRGEP